MFTQAITTYTHKGLFNATEVPLVSLNASGSIQEFSFEIKGGKDPLTMLIDIPSTGSGEHTLFALTKNGNEIPIALVPQRLNIVSLNSFGLADDDGIATFRYYTDNIDGIAMIGIKVAVIKHITVVNN